jgi:hypothetical protein
VNQGLLLNWIELAPVIDATENKNIDKCRFYYYFFLHHDAVEQLPIEVILPIGPDRKESSKFHFFPS